MKLNIHLPIVSLLIIWFSPFVRGGHNEFDEFQPNVTIIDGSPGRINFGTYLNFPNGSIWCAGKPTIWPVGHWIIDSPYCQEEDGTWERNDTAKLDLIEPLMIGQPRGGLRNMCNITCIDRHECHTLHVNDDDLLDIVCFTGAGKSKGHGFAEIYLTQPDGSLEKVHEFHGLQTYDGMSTRPTTLLHSVAHDAALIFVGTNGKLREDNLTNAAQMYLHTSTEPPYFEPLVNGTWSKRHYHARQTVTTDYNRDRRDDVFVLRKKYGPVIFRQPGLASNPWKVNRPPKGHRGNWQRLVASDVTGDGVADLVVVKKIYKAGQKIIVYEGTPNRARHGFNFTDPPYYEKGGYRRVQDIEVLDVNGDGISDIYIVRDGENGYCNILKSTRMELFYGGEAVPPDGFVPPNDTRSDILLVGTGDANNPFVEVVLNHQYPGCGYRAKKFGDGKLFLSQGSDHTFGYSLLLEW